MKIVFVLAMSSLYRGFMPGGDSAYERGGDARRNFELNP